jgi:hypothetical protein
MHGRILAEPENEAEADPASGAALDGTLTLADDQAASRRPWPMPKPRVHIRHIGRTYYLSEWWDE